MPSGNAWEQQPQVIEDHPWNNAEAFLGELSPQALWWQPDPSRWLFRGHSSASYELKAKAHRDPNDFCAAYGVAVRAPSSVDPQWSIDADRLSALVKAFGAALDAAGLPIPSPSPSLELTARNSKTGDPEPGAMPLVALMQHLGLPTPWLDWTVQARVGAYFAAVGAAKKPRRATDIVVWALRRDFVEDADELRTGIKLVMAPRATNARLHAQGGVFTWLRGDDAHAKTVDGLARELVAKPAIWHAHRQPALPVMRRFLLPSTEAPKLLRLLSYEGVTAATVFPGYEGVVLAMQERALWDRL
jgi:hypothetical protein